MKKTRTFVAVFLTVCLAAVGLTAAVQALSAERAAATAVSADVLEYYAAQHMRYIDEMPESLQREYADVIALADDYLLMLYGDDTMVSTSEDFVLDLYCIGIKLGLVLDLDDPDIISQLLEFANAAAELYIVKSANARYEEPTREPAAAEAATLEP